MKKLLNLLLVCALVFGLTACSKGESKENTLTNITDENIIKGDVEATGLEGFETLGGVCNTEISAEKFNGVKTLYHTSLVGDSDMMVTITGLKVDSGNLRICVLNNDEIIKELSVSKEEKEYKFKKLNGSFAVTVAGEDASFKFNLAVE